MTPYFWALCLGGVVGVYNYLTMMIFFHPKKLARRRDLIEERFKNSFLKNILTFLSIAALLATYFFGIVVVIFGKWFVAKKYNLNVHDEIVGDVGLIICAFYVFTVVLFLIINRRSWIEERKRAIQD